MKTQGKVVDSTTYKAGIANMEPGVKWDKVFVAKHATRTKDPQLLCVVISMPEWYDLLHSNTSLLNSLKEQKEENQRLSESLYNARACMYQSQDKLRKGIKNVSNILTKEQ